MKREPITEQDIEELEQYAKAFIEKMRSVEDKSVGPYAERYLRIVLATQKLLKD